MKQPSLSRQFQVRGSALWPIDNRQISPSHQHKIAAIKLKYQKLIDQNHSPYKRPQQLRNTQHYQKNTSREVERRNIDKSDRNQIYYGNAGLGKYSENQRKQYDPKERVDFTHNFQRRKIQAQQTYMGTEINQQKYNKSVPYSTDSYSRTRAYSLNSAQQGQNLNRQPLDITHSQRYQQIINKYSLPSVSKQYSSRSRSCYQTQTQNQYVPTNRQPTPTRHIQAKDVKKRLNSNQIQLKNKYIDKYSNGKKQLSVISQISNSNHSQSPEQNNPNKTFTLQNKIHSKSLYQTYQNTSTNNVNAESYLIVGNDIPEKRNDRSFFKDQNGVQTSNLLKQKNKNGSYKQQKIWNNNMPTTIQQTQYKQYSFEKETKYDYQREISQKNRNKIEQTNAQKSAIDAIIAKYLHYPSKEVKAYSNEKQYTPSYHMPEKSARNDIQGNSNKVKSKYGEPQQYKRQYREYSIDKPKQTLRETNKTHTKDDQKDSQGYGYTPSKRDTKDIALQINRLDQKIKNMSAKQQQRNYVDYSEKYCSFIEQKPQNVLTYKEHNTSINDTTSYDSKYQAYLQKIKPLYSQITLPHVRNPNNFSINLVAVTNDHQISNQEYIHSKQKSNNHLLEERRPRSHHKTQTNTSLKTFVKVLAEQAAFDQAFRNNKIWLQGVFKADKWSSINQQLKIRGIEMSLQQIKQIFQLGQNQNNPFFSVTDHNCDFKAVVHTYEKAQNYWEENVVGQFSQQKLLKEGLDKLQGQQILIQDLVRFLNLQSGTFLRSRDVALIYKRLSQKGRVSLSSLLNKVCGQ